MTVTAPPIKLHDLFKPQVRYQIENMVWHDDAWRLAAKPASFLGNRAQRVAMQMVEVRMRNQHQVNRREIANADARLAQPLQNKKPASKIRIDHHVLTADLHQEAGVSNEGQPQLAIPDQLGLMDLTGTPGNC